MPSKEFMALMKRHQELQHAMQSGIAMIMNYDPKIVDTKHLRVGVNTALSDHGALIELLISKGVFTEEEYAKSLVKFMEREVRSLEERISAHLGGGSISRT